jgi:hypothetical protein
LAEVVLQNLKDHTLTGMQILTREDPAARSEVRSKPGRVLPTAHWPPLVAIKNPFDFDPKRPSIIDRGVAT